MTPILFLISADIDVFSGELSTVQECSTDKKDFEARRQKYNQLASLRKDGTGPNYFKYAGTYLILSCLINTIINLINSLSGRFIKPKYIQIILE